MLIGFLVLPFVWTFIACRPYAVGLGRRFEHETALDHHARRIPFYLVVALTLLSFYGGAQIMLHRELEPWRCLRSHEVRREIHMCHGVAPFMVCEPTHTTETVCDERSP
jgi:hypothetical protein